MRKRPAGFTVVELGLVIAVVAILLFLLIPALTRAREESRKKDCKENLSEIAEAVFCYTNSGEFFPFAWGPANGMCSTAPGGTNTDMCDPGTSLGELYPLYLNTANKFRCPSTEDRPSFVANTPQGIVRITNPDGWSRNFNYTLKSNQPLVSGSDVTRACSYGYDPRIYPSAVSSMAMLADWNGSGMTSGSRSSQNHAGAQNVLYVDGSVKWQATNHCSCDPTDDIFIEGGIGADGKVVYWNADTDVYLVNAPTTLGLSYNEYTQLQQ